jgi:hypothetical protein
MMIWPHRTQRSSIISLASVRDRLGALGTDAVPEVRDTAAADARADVHLPALRQYSQSGNGSPYCISCHAHMASGISRRPP